MVLKKECEHAKQYEQLMRITGSRRKSANVIESIYNEGYSTSSAALVDHPNWIIDHGNIWCKEPQTERIFV